MTKAADSRTSGAASLLFLLFSLALAGVVHVGFTEPAIERRNERRELHLELEGRWQESDRRRLALSLEDRALDHDPQTQERALRAADWSRPGETRIAMNSPR